MATIVTRAGKGSPLTNNEVDANFTNLNSDKLESGDTVASLTITSADINGGTIDGVTIGGASAGAATFTSATVNGNITVTGTVDGRDVATDGTKLDGIEAGADVTDTTNVTAAGALMDSELTNITAVKALDQGVATTDSPSFAGITATGDVDIADKIVHTGDTNTAIRFPAADTVTVETAGSERVRVDSSGNVGIGTSSPAEELDVNGTIKATNVSDGTLSISTTYVTNGSAKAWINFNGTGTIAARDSLNVSSLTDNGTGDYTISFTNAFGAADYTVAGNGNNTNALWFCPQGLSTFLASSVGMQARDSTTLLADIDTAVTSCHGDLA